MSLDTSALPAPRRPRRWGLYLPFAALVVVALAWSAVWFYGRHRVNAELDAFLAREASLGREWTCPGRSIGGFPFRIEGRCVAPAYRGRTAEGETTGSLKGLTVVATTAGAFGLGGSDAAHVITEFEGPLVVRAAGLPEATATWRAARSSLRGGGDRLDRVSLEVEALAVALGDGRRWSADRLAAHLRRGVDPAVPNAYDLAMRLTGATLPDLDLLLNSRDPVNLDFDSRLLNAGPIDRQDWRQTIENWRENGGTLRVERLRLAKGQPRLEATGELRLDMLRRPEGQLDASFVNAGALLQQFGIGIGGGGGGLLGALLGGGPRRAPAAEGGQRPEQTMRLPLTLADGRLAVGPFRVPGVQLRPLY